MVEMFSNAVEIISNRVEMFSIVVEFINLNQIQIQINAMERTPITNSSKLTNLTKLN